MWKCMEEMEPIVTTCEQEILPTSLELFGKKERHMKGTRAMRHSRVG